MLQGGRSGLIGKLNEAGIIQIKRPPESSHPHLPKILARLPDREIEFDLCGFNRVNAKSAERNPPFSLPEFRFYNAPAIFNRLSGSCNGLF